MRKFVLAFVLLVSSASIVAAQKEYSGVMKLQFGYVTVPGGLRIPVRGLMVPWTAKLAKLNRDGQKPPPSGGGGDSLMIYQNDNAQDAYNGIGLDCPSSMDDISIVPSGVNQSWTIVKFGIQTSTGAEVLIRWRFYDTYTGGLGAGVSAVSNEIDDFGGYWTPPISGDNPWAVTFNWGAAIPFSVPDAEFWMAMQFRERHLSGNPPQEDGEGAFRFDYKPLFNGTGVTIGASNDIFWLDNPPEDGIYDETENDQFDPPGPPNLANFAFAATTGGTILSTFPQTGTVVAGLSEVGNVFNTWFSDDDYWQVKSNPRLRDPVFPISLKFDSAFSGTVTTVNSLRFTIEAHGNMSGMRQRVWLRKYSTNQWIELSNVILTTSDTTVSVLVPNSMGPTNFIQAGTKAVSALVQYTEPSPFAPGPYRAYVDSASWTATKP